MRVIVTRPEREARAWVQALSQHGLDAWALPLITIHAQPDTSALRAAWRQLGDYVALMFVSGAAVEHFFAQRTPSRNGPHASPAPTPRFWATGPGTAAALRRCGIAVNQIDAPAPDGGQFDSEALWDVVGARVQPGDRVLIVRGGDGLPRSLAGPSQERPHRLGGPGEARTGVTNPAAPLAGSSPSFGRDWLAQRLLEAGARVDFVPVYWRGTPAFSGEQMALARGAACDGSVWLFTSAQALANLLACMPGQGWADARALATHGRIADAARMAGFGVVWESRPRISDVVASIESNR